MWEYCVWKSREISGNNCPRRKLPHLTPKLTLTQTLTRGNSPRGQLSGCPPTLKLTLTFIQTKISSRGNFLWGQIVRIPSYPEQFSAWVLIIKTYSFIKSKLHWRQGISENNVRKRLLIQGYIASPVTTKYWSHFFYLFVI